MLHHRPWFLEEKLLHSIVCLTSAETSGACRIDFRNLREFDTFLVSNPRLRVAT